MVLSSSDSKVSLISLGFILVTDTVPNLIGRIELGDPGKIKMLMQHRNDKPIGRMQKFNEAEDGIYASFKISASMQGSDALMLASEQLAGQRLCCRSLFVCEFDVIDV